MPATPHVEHHFTGSESVRDVVIGMADGLTVPFALAAGLTAAVTSTHVIVTAGLAEVAAGAIAMGLGGYLAARSDQEHYASEERREHDETEKLREIELGETADIFRSYGLEGAALEQVTRAIPDPRRAPISAFTIAISYVVGGLIPLMPYILGLQLRHALIFSVVLTGIALAIFGAVKGRLTGISMLKSALQTMLVGGLAAGAAFYLASLFGG